MYHIAIIIAFALAIIIVVVMLFKKDHSADTPLFQGPGEDNLDLESPENTLYLELNDGRVVIQLRPDLAPMHVARIKQLVRKGYYDGLNFHRVIEDFMAQGGDPMGNGSGGSGLNIGAEFSKEKFERGVVGMARSQGNDSADSQFFIMLGDGRWLDNKYTTWGIVKSGMEFVDKIKVIDSSTVGTREYNPDSIVSMKIAADETSKTAE